jgi:hypothetical protein
MIIEFFSETPSGAKDLYRYETIQGIPNNAARAFQL